MQGVPWCCVSRQTKAHRLLGRISFTAHTIKRVKRAPFSSEVQVLQRTSKSLDGNNCELLRFAHMCSPMCYQPWGLKYHCPEKTEHSPRVAACAPTRLYKEVFSSPSGLTHFAVPFAGTCAQLLPGMRVVPHGPQSTGSGTIFSTIFGERHRTLL